MILAEMMARMMALSRNGKNDGKNNGIITTGVGLLTHGGCCENQFTTIEVAVVKTNSPRSNALVE
jgi:hypothetical protein